jgi:hypothetical protein
MKLSKFSIADDVSVAPAFVTRLMIGAVALIAVTACTTTGGLSRVKSGPLYASIAVDVETVRAKNLGDYADVIGRAEKAAINAVYDGQVQSKNSALPSLVIEIDSIDMGVEHDVGFSIDPLKDHGSQIIDMLDGYAIVTKGGKDQRKEHIIASLIYPENRAYSPTDTQDRLNALTRVFAEQARSQLGD